MTSISQTSSPAGPKKKKLGRVLKILLLVLVCIIALPAAFLFSVRLAENGKFGPGLQNWVRIEKARFVFNRIYSLAAPPFELQANRLLVESAEGLAPGTALDVAAGQGRNSLYLASKGWKVTAFDVSDKGLAVAGEQARAAGLKLDLVRASAQEFDYGTDRWDLMLLSYAPIPYDDAGLLVRIRRSIKPGGLLVIDTPILMHQPATVTPRVPGDLQNNELPTLFPDFEVLRYDETDDTTEWFRLKMKIGRFVAKRRLIAEGGLP